VTQDNWKLPQHGHIGMLLSKFRSELKLCFYLFILWSKAFLGE